MESVDRKRMALGLLLLMALFVAGCMEPDRVTRENYDKLKLGMDAETVFDTLGNPQEASTQWGIKAYTWVSGEKHIHAKFVAGRAVYYSQKNLPPALPVAGEAAGR